MRKTALMTAALALLASCMEQTATPEALPPGSQGAVVTEGGEVIVEGPVGPTYYTCADGTEVEAYAVIGGAYIIIEGRGIEMPQIWPEGETGYVHQVGNLVWIVNQTEGAQLFLIEEGQTIETAPRIPCTEVSGPPIPLGSEPM